MTTKRRPDLIKGVGIDLIEIDRIRESLIEYGVHFTRRLFTKKEIEYCEKQEDSATRFAGRFAAKEAIAKALGTGFGEELSFLDLEILPNTKGAPQLTFSKQADEKFKKPKIHLSISHNRKDAIAIALWYD
ncbi:MAG: holo-ACP synthase [Simkaniaceae bacterium]